MALLLLLALVAACGADGASVTDPSSRPDSGTPDVSIDASSDVAVDVGFDATDPEDVFDPGEPTCDDLQCGSEEACYRGACYDACQAQADCGPGSRCAGGHCAPFECAGISCDDGESCLGGLCYPPCDGGSEVCPPLDFVTEEAGALTASSAQLRATVIELPVHRLEDHGFCWSTFAEPSEEQGACHSLDTAMSLGGFEHLVEDLDPGTRYYVRAYAVDAEDRFYGNEVSFVTLAPAPTEVTASQGTSTLEVEVSWQALPGLAGHLIFRDGVQIGEVYGATTTFTDTGATPPAGGGVPTELTASSGTFSDKVQVNWNAPSSDESAQHAYTVVAVYTDTSSAPSDPAIGFRASAGSSYQVFRDGVLIDITETTTYDDFDAEAAPLPDAPTLTATAGDHLDRVALEWNEPSAQPGATHTYHVVPLTDGEAGDESPSDSGFREAFSISGYELRIDDEAWTDVGAVLGYDDHEAAGAEIAIGPVSASAGLHSNRVALSVMVQASPGLTRTYQVRATTDGGVGQASEPQEGYRGVEALSVQWQRSAGDEDGSFSNLPNAIFADHDDFTAPEDGSGRYYRVITAAGALLETSESVRGFRSALPQVATEAADDTGAAVVLHGNLLTLGAPDPGHGFCWGTAPDPALPGGGSVTCADLGTTSQTGAFSHVASNVVAGVPYYVRAFATTNAGTVYGGNVIFERQWAGPRAFTSCGASGRFGPTQAQCNGAYSGSAVSGEVTVTSGIQHWTVPATGTYRIEVFGAQGGPSQVAAGNGARMRGDFALQAGTVLRILVGQQGSAIANGGAGGGGGTFVVNQAGNIPLIVAGGGMGGNNHTASGYNASQGGATTNTGVGGGDFGYSTPVSGGGGFGGNGAGEAPGLSFMGGGAGGAGPGEGGFGGGGGKGGSTLNGAAGGGGYSGGAGNNTAGAYSGGGSHNSGTNQSNNANVRVGHGAVTIDLVP